MSCHPARLQNSSWFGRFGGSSEHTQHGLGTADGGGRWTGAFSDRRGLVSLPRVPTSHPVVFVLAAFRQTISGGPFQPLLAARHSPALGDGRDPTCTV